MSGFTSNVSIITEIMSENDDQSNIEMIFLNIVSLLEEKYTNMEDSTYELIEKLVIALYGSCKNLMTHHIQHKIYEEQNKRKTTKQLQDNDITKPCSLLWIITQITKYIHENLKTKKIQSIIKKNENHNKTNLEDSYILNEILKHSLDREYELYLNEYLRLDKQKKMLEKYKKEKNIVIY